MKQIVKYGTIVAPSFDELDILVNGEIQKGWQPIGGVQAFQCLNYHGKLETGRAQAMVKYEEED